MPQLLSTNPPLTPFRQRQRLESPDRPGLMPTKTTLSQPTPSHLAGLHPNSQKQKIPHQLCRQHPKLHSPTDFPLPPQNTIHEMPYCCQKQSEGPKTPRFAIFRSKKNFSTPNSPCFCSSRPSGGSVLRRTPWPKPGITFPEAKVSLLGFEEARRLGHRPGLFRPKKNQDI